MISLLIHFSSSVFGRACGIAPLLGKERGGRLRSVGQQLGPVKKG
jgi:hypothetical protein